MISINTLFPDGPQIKKYSGLDTESLFCNVLETRKKRFTPDKILKNIHNKRKKKVEGYIFYYNLCLNKIEAVDQEGHTDLVFSVPRHIPEKPYYNLQECINYLVENLRQNGMDVLQMNRNSVFITWKDIELTLHSYEETVND